MGSVEGFRNYVCAGCGGNVIMIAALRHLAPSFAQQVWGEGPAASPEADHPVCPFCSREMQPKAVATGTAAMCKPCEAVWLNREAAGAVQVKTPDPDQPTLGSQALRCGQCGAPIADSSAEKCQYCGAAIHAPVEVVVMQEPVADYWSPGNRRGAPGLLGEVLGEFLHDRR
jgi:hypothetical protein